MYYNIVSEYKYIGGRKGIMDPAINIDLNIKYSERILKFFF